MKKPISYILLFLFTLPALAQTMTILTQRVTFNLNGVQTEGKIRRNYNTYPATAAGDNAVRAAVETGILTVTLTSGIRNDQVIQARVTSPPVSTTTTTGTVPTWVPTTRYSYANAKLTVEAYAIPSGETPYLSFAAVSGATLTGLSGGGANLTSGTFYHPGGQTSQGLYVWEWTFQSGNGTAGIPAGVPIRVTYRKGTGTETYARDFTPSVGTNINLLSAGNSSPPTSTTTPPPSTTVAGSQVFAYADQGWDSNSDIKYLENDKIKVGFRKSVGACICQIFDKTGDPTRNLINDLIINHNGQTFRDKGRQFQLFSDYYSPGREFQVVPGKNTKDYGNDTGGNVVQGGNAGPWYDVSPVDASAVVNHPTRGQMIYYKVRPMVWGVQGEVGPMTGEGNVWLDGYTICYATKHTYGERTPLQVSQLAYEARSQENPIVIALPTFSDKKTVVSENADETVSVVTQAQGYSTPFISSKCYVGQYDHSGVGFTVRTGLTQYTPRNSFFQTSQDQGIYGDADGNANAATTVAYLFNYDSPGSYENDGYVIVGNETRAKQVMTTLPAPDQSLNFDFTTDNHRWHNLNCKVRKESGLPAPALWKVYLGDVRTDAGNGSTVINGNFSSPYRAWQASGITQISFDMAVTGMSSVKFIYQKPGLFVEGNRYDIVIPVTGDGVRRTYTINTSGLQNWNGTIARFGLEANGQASANGTLIPYRVFKP